MESGNYRAGSYRINQQLPNLLSTSKAIALLKFTQKPVYKTDTNRAALLEIVPHCLLGTLLLLPQPLAPSPRELQGTSGAPKAVMENR